MPVLACGHIARPAEAPLLTVTEIRAPDDVVQILAGFGLWAAIDTHRALWSGSSSSQRPEKVTAGVRSAALGWESLVVADCDGNVTEREILSEGSSESSVVRPVVIEDHRATQVAIGEHHRLAVAEDGSIFHWAVNYGQPDTDIMAQRLPLPSLDVPVSLITVHQVACGARHSAAVAAGGQLLCWGWNLHSQCGGDPCSSVMQPRLVPLPPHLHCKQVAAGLGHTVALCTDGGAYGLGLNADGQLGSGDSHSRSAPALIEVPDEDADVIQVACGARHTVVVTDVGVALSCGWGKWGQLGRPAPSEASGRHTGSRGCSNDCMAPLVLPPPGGRVLTAACGRWSTLLLVS